MALSRGDMSGYGALHAQEKEGQGCALSGHEVWHMHKYEKNVLTTCNSTNLSFSNAYNGYEEYLKL